MPRYVSGWRTGASRFACLRFSFVSSFLRFSRFTVGTSQRASSSGSFGPSDSRWMSRLVHPKFLSARQAHLGDSPPGLFVDGPGLHTFGAKFGDRSVDVVAHQIELVVLAASFGGMNRELARRCGKDQPASPDVN